MSSPRPLRPFMTWDGEGAEPEPGSGKAQRYVLMAASDYDHLWREEGIPSMEALEWLCSYGAARPGIHVGFGTSYDVNMILGDVGYEEVTRLYLYGEATFEIEGSSWYLQWIPGKIFNIRHPLGYWYRSYDAFGFFQCSFVAALERWQLEVPAWLVEMKGRRGTFQGHEWELKAYSELECRLLAQLMEKVRERLHGLGLRPRSWHGSGAIASAALHREGVKLYRGPESRRHAIDDAILRAYFGGRTELFIQGELPSVTQYDVNSAYAAACSLLPDGRGEWRRAPSYEAGKWSPWGLWRARWDLDDEHETVAPLPFRSGRSIHFPIRGEGWYHTAELKAALRAYPERIDVLGGYVFEPSSNAKPFEFVHELYRRRQELQAAGDPAATLLKFGLASVWGKLSQATGLDGKRPAFQDYFWAGAVTALIRAWMLDIAVAHRERIVQISTDGIILAGRAETPLDDRIGDELGQLRRTYLQSVLLAQPGMMSAWEAESGEPIVYTRGFFKKEIDFEKLRAVWRADGPHGQLRTAGIRFNGIGTCLALGNRRKWRRWSLHRQTLSLHSSRKFYSMLRGHGGGAYVLLPAYEIRSGLSDAYVPKLTPIEAVMEQLEWVQGTEQPLLSF